MYNSGSYKDKDLFFFFDLIS